MFSIRRATQADIPAIIDLAVESVTRSPLPVRIDREEMRETAVACISNNACFVWVAVVDGVVVGCVASETSKGFWFERMQTSVLLFYTRHPGSGIALLREFARWVKARPVIKMAIFSLEHDADPRIGLLLKRLGFGLQNPQYTYVRGL